MVQANGLNVLHHSQGNVAVGGRRWAMQRRGLRLPVDTAMPLVGSSIGVLIECLSQ
jgi:hypothetical protein